MTKAITDVHAAWVARGAALFVADNTRGVVAKFRRAGEASQTYMNRPVYSFKPKYSISLTMLEPLTLCLGVLLEQLNHF